MTTLAIPLVNIGLAAQQPDVVRSCVVLQPSPPPDPGEEPPAPVTGPGIYTPIAPGVTYANLPVAPTIVDTSPDQMIGCIITVADNPQGRLDALFPSAVDGDGVIDRATNDIWVYDGATWNNVGPTPGPTIVATTVIPPWNEILLAVARTRTKLSVNALAYALQLLTEPDPIVTTTALVAKSQRVVKVGATDIALAAQTPSFDNPYTAIRSVFSVTYTGTGSTRTISGLPWQPSIVWIKNRTFGFNHIIADSLRGATFFWRPNTIDSESNNSSVVSAFTADGFTVGSDSQTNASNSNYIAWAFPPTGAASSNTSGIATTTVAKADFYSIITYTGNSISGSTIGHGLSQAPELVIIKRRTGFTAAIAGGPAVGDNTVVFMDSSAERAGSSSYVRTTSSTTITLGNEANVNSSSVPYVAYAFHSVPKLCKIGTYTGDGNAAGAEINCGFTVDFLLVKRTIGGSGDWNLIDSARNLQNNRLLANSGNAETTVTNFYELTASGFIPKRGNQTTDHDLNINGSTYVYMAIGSFRPTVLAPLTTIGLAAETPSVTAN